MSNGARYPEISVHAPKQIAMKGHGNDEAVRYMKQGAGLQGRHGSLRPALTPKTFCTRESYTVTAGDTTYGG